MGEKLLKYYKFIKEKEGLTGQMKLAQRTLIPSPKAAMEPDSPELIKKFRAAIKEITGTTPPFY